MQKTKDNWCAWIRGSEHFKNMLKAEKQVQASVDIVWKYFEADTNAEVKIITNNLIKMLQLVGNLDNDLADVKAEMDLNFKAIRDQGDVMFGLVTETSGDIKEVVANQIKILEGQNQQEEHNAWQRAKWEEQSKKEEAASALATAMENAKTEAAEKAAGKAFLSAFKAVTLTGKAVTTETGDQTEIVNENAQQFWTDSFEQKSYVTEVTLEDFGLFSLGWLGLMEINPTLQLLSRSKE